MEDFVASNRVTLVSDPPAEPRKKRLAMSAAGHFSCRDAVKLGCSLYPRKSPRLSPTIPVIDLWLRGFGQHSSIPALVDADLVTIAQA